MNAAERQALRERHAEQYGFCVYCFAPDPDAFSEFMPVDYPCDVIKVLDAFESRNGLVNPARMDTCTHYGIDSGGTDYYGTSNPPQEADWGYTFCPECGEKL